MKYPTKRLHSFALLLTLMAVASARADLVVSVTSIAASPGSIDNAVDVDLTNNGVSAVTLGGFSFGLSVADPDITFTAANISTLLPYIFTGDSLLGPVISFPAPVGSSVTAADIDASGSGITLNAGQEVGLGHVFFDVAPSASSGIFALSFTGWPTTSLSDAIENDVPITGLVGGEIEIATQTVPESGAALYTAGLMLLVISLLRKRNHRLVTNF